MTQLGSSLPSPSHVEAVLQDRRVATDVYLHHYCHKPVAGSELSHTHTQCLYRRTRRLVNQVWVYMCIDTCTVYYMYMYIRSHVCKNASQWMIGCRSNHECVCACVYEMHKLITERKPMQIYYTTPKQRKICVWCLALRTGTYVVTIWWLCPKTVSSQQTLHLYSCIHCTFIYCTPSLLQYPHDTPKFDHYSNNLWPKRHRARQAFIRAARRVLIQVTLCCTTWNMYIL